jgi:hypothetical protein
VRQILVDHARKRNADKQDGQRQPNGGNSAIKIGKPGIFRPPTE